MTAIGMDSRTCSGGTSRTVILYMKDDGGIMSKKHRTVVPDFSSHKPQAGTPSAPATKGAKPAPPPVPKAKPQATSSKSGHRGS
jgi:hypothetical protein